MSREGYYQQHAQHDPAEAQEVLDLLRPASDVKEVRQ
jgi:hypothetical protein